MTECIFKPDEFDLECIGHASDGDDKLPCVALTVLVNTLAYNLMGLSGIIEKKEINIQSGHAKIHIVPKANGKTQLRFLFNSFVNGIYALATDPNLKECIKLKVYEGGKVYFDSEIMESDT